MDSFIKIPNTENYFIDLKCRRIYKRENDGYYIMDNSLPLVVVINNQTLTKDINWYFWYTVYDLDFPEELNIDLNKLNFKKTNVNKYATGVYEYTPVYDEPLEIKHDNKVFRILLPFLGYGITDDGTVYSFKTNSYLQLQLGKMASYYRANVTFRLYNLKKHKYVFLNKQIPVHRLVARAWLEYPESDRSLCVDHINSDKLDNRVSNLRWVDYAVNSTKELHGALDYAFLLRNVDTGEVTPHVSLMECSKYIGRSRIRPKLTLFDSGRIFVGRYGRFELKRYNDESDWYYKKLLNGVTPNIYIKYPNGDIDYVSNVKEVIRSVSGVRWSCNFKDVKEDAAKLGVETDYIIPIFVKDKTFQAYNIETKEILEFDRIKQIIRAVPVAEATVYKYLKNNWNNVPLNGYLFRVKDDTEWPTEIKDKNTDYGRCGIIFINTDTEDIVRFESIKEASEAAGISPGHLIRKCNAGVTLNYNGSIWKIKRD